MKVALKKREFQPAHVQLRDMYKRLSQAAESALPEDKIIYNFGQFIPLNENWKKHGIDGKRIPQVEQSLIEIFRSPGPPVGWSKDDQQRYMAEVLHAISDMSQVDAMQHLVNGNLRKFVRSRAIDRFKNKNSDIYHRSSKGLTPYQKAMANANKIALSMGTAFIESPGPQSIGTFQILDSLELSASQVRIARFLAKNQGSTYAQIAENLNMSEAAVKQCLYRVRKKTENK